MSFTLEVSKTGKDAIIFNKFKYRECYSVKSGDIVWRCLGRSCKASIRTNSEKTGIFTISESHTGPHPVTLRTLTPTQQKHGRSFNSPNVRDSDVEVYSPPTPTTPEANFTTSSPTLDTTRETAELESTLKKTDAENADLKEQLAVLKERLNCVLDHTVESDARLLQYTNEIFTLNTSYHNPCQKKTVDCASQCDIDTHNDLLSEVAALRVENENLKIKISDNIQTSHEKELEISSLKNKIQELSKELKLLSGGDLIRKSFNKNYPNDSYTCLTKRMETDLYCKNIEIKELSQRNSELSKEINTLNTITEMLQLELEEAGSQIKQITSSKICSTCFPPLNTTHTWQDITKSKTIENNSITSSPHQNLNILVHPDVHCTMDGTTVLPQNNNQFHTVISKRRCKPRSQITHDQIVCKNRFEVLSTCNTEHSKSHNSKHEDIVEERTSSTIRRRRLVIASDSHGRGLSWHLQNRLQDYDVMVSSFPGAPFDYVARKLEKLTTDFNHDDVAVIMAGTNDITSGNDSRFTKHFNFKPLKSLASRTTVKVLNIPFRFDKPEFNFPIHCINSTMQKFCVNTKHMSFIQTLHLNRICYTRHGLHFNKKGKRALADIIHNAVTSSHPTRKHDISTTSSNIHTSLDIGSYPSGQPSQQLQDQRGGHSGPRNPSSGSNRLVNSHTSRPLRHLHVRDTVPKNMVDIDIDYTSLVDHSSIRCVDTDLLNPGSMNLNSSLTSSPDPC